MHVYIYIYIADKYVVVIIVVILNMYDNVIVVLKSSNFIHPRKFFAHDIP